MPQRLISNSLACRGVKSLDLVTNLYSLKKKLINGCAGSLLLGRLSLAVANGDCSLLQCKGFSPWHLLSWRGTGSRSIWVSVVAGGGPSSCGMWALELGLSGPVAFGIFLDQGLNLHPLHWQADSYPLCYHGSPASYILVAGAFLALTICQLLQMWKRTFIHSFMSSSLPLTNI